MPLYEYECRQCHNEFERLSRLSADIPVVCPRCDSQDTAKKISTFVVTGWTRRKPTSGKLEPDEYQLIPTDHSDEEDWADF